jgi:methionyl aminopeptidase
MKLRPGMTGDRTDSERRVKAKPVPSRSVDRGTVDRSLSAQFEHTVLVSETGYEILTDRDQVPVALAS